MLKELDPQALETIGKEHAEAMQRLTGKYPVPPKPKTKALDDAEQAIRAAALACGGIDADQMVINLRKQAAGQTAKK